MNETAGLLESILEHLGSLRQAEAQIRELIKHHPDEAGLLTAGQAALKAIEAWDQAVIQPLHETLEDEDAWETMLAGQVRYLLDVIDETGAPVTAGALDRLQDLQATWDGLKSDYQRIQQDHIAPINDRASGLGLEYVSGADR